MAGCGGRGPPVAGSARVLGHGRWADETNDPITGVAHVSSTSRATYFEEEVVTSKGELELPATPLVPDLLFPEAPRWRAG